MKVEKEEAITQVSENWLDGKNKFMFILFAEFLGYVSPLIDWAEAICEGKSIEEFKQKLLILDADFLLRKMNEDFNLNELKEWWDTFYPYLEQYESNSKASVDDLPY